MTPTSALPIGQKPTGLIPASPVLPPPPPPRHGRRLLATVSLFAALAAVGYGLILVKAGKVAAAEAAARQQPEHTQH